MSKCLNCGRELKDSAKFCPACGSPVPVGKEAYEKRSDEKEPAAKDPVEKCTAVASGDGEAAGHSTAGAPAGDAVSHAAKTLTVKTIALISAAVVALAAAGAAVYTVATNSTSALTQEEEEPEEDIYAEETADAEEDTYAEEAAGADGEAVEEFTAADNADAEPAEEATEEETAEEETAEAEELSFPYEGIYDNDVNRAAVEEYMYILQNDYDINGDYAATPYFALMDVNGDGVYEMIVSVYGSSTAENAGYFFWYDEESGEAVKEEHLLGWIIYYNPQTSEILGIYEHMGALVSYYTFTGSSLEAEEDKGGFLESDAYTYYTTGTLEGYEGYESSEEEWALEETIIEEMEEFIDGAEEAGLVMLAEEEFTDYFGLGTEEYGLDGFSDYAAVIMSGYSWCHQYDDYISLKTDIYAGRYVEKAAVDSASVGDALTCGGVTYTVDEILDDNSLILTDTDGVSYKLRPDVDEDPGMDIQPEIDGYYSILVFYGEYEGEEISYTTDCSYLIESNVILHIAPDATVTYMDGNRELVETDAYSYFTGIDGDDSFLDRFWVQYDEDGLVTSLTFMYRP